MERWRDEWIACGTESLSSATCAQWIDDREIYLSQWRLRCRVSLSSDGNRRSTYCKRIQNKNKVKKNLNIERNILEISSIILFKYKSKVSCHLSLSSSIWSRDFSLSFVQLSDLIAQLSRFIYSMIVLLICEVDNLSILIHKCLFSKKSGAEWLFSACLDLIRWPLLLVSTGLLI